jgi:hypothetical protein
MKRTTNPETTQTTRSFARVIGPFFGTVSAIFAIKAHSMGETLSGTFDIPVITWLFGALLLFGGILIIANHQIWRGFAAIFVSIFGWFLGFRGFMMLAFPELIKRGAEGAMTPGSIIFVQIMFGIFSILGFYLTYLGYRKNRE